MVNFGPLVYSFFLVVLLFVANKDKYVDEC